MRRKKQQLEEAECKKILREEKRGVLALSGDEGYTYAVPMNFFYDENENKIYFHGAKQGHKMDSIKRNNKVSFCVYNSGVKRKDHWSFDVESVIIFGRIIEIENRDKAYQGVEKLALKYYPDALSVKKEMDSAFNVTACLELEIEHMTGKKINES